MDVTLIKDNRVLLSKLVCLSIKLSLGTIMEEEKGILRQVETEVVRRMNNATDIC